VRGGRRRAAAAAIERDLCWMALRALLRGRGRQAAAAWPAFRDDPAALLRLPRHLLQVVLAKLQGRYAPEPA
jgi:hypothetical protein